MSNTYHDPIALGAPANAATFNAPMGQLDAQIDTNTTTLAAVAAKVDSIQAGNTAMTQLNLGTPTTLTIAGGVVTATRSYHLIDTESAAATDDLDTINGGTTGDYLILQSVSSSRDIRLRTTGNILPANGVANYLDETNRMIALHYDGTKWREVTMSVALTGTYDGTLGNARSIKVPDGIIRTSGGQSSSDTPFLSVMPRPDARIFVMEKAAAATYASIGMAAGTNAGAGGVTNSNDDTTTWVEQAIANVSGTFGGRRSTTFDLVRLSHNPYFMVMLRTGSDISTIRFWVGLTSAQVTNVDNLAAIHFAGFRYSTVAADAGWLAVVKDGATQNSTPTGVSIATSSAYKLELWLTASAAYFSVNGSVPVSLTTNLPGTSQDLGFTVSAITTSASAKTIAISRIFVEYN